MNKQQIAAWKYNCFTTLRRRMMREYGGEQQDFRLGNFQFAKNKPYFEYVFSYLIKHFKVELEKEAEK